MEKITVYYFTKYDINTDKEVRSKRMATLEYINRVKGTTLRDTAREVNEAEIDENGRYPRK